MDNIVFLVLGKVFNDSFNYRLQPSEEDKVFNKSQ